MKERITFVRSADDPFDLEQFRLDNDALHLSGLTAAREDRLTFSLYELPQELWRVLKQCHELHIRWASPEQYSSVPPFVSRVSPGLHIFFTQQESLLNTLLCPLLQKLFGVRKRCVMPIDVFTDIPKLSNRFTSSTAFQCYDLVNSLDSLAIYIQQKICSAFDEVCLARAISLHTASYLDIDYDAISQMLVLTMFRHELPALGKWNEKVQSSEGKARVEVGVFANEKPIESEELSLGGFQAIVGEDKKPNPTRFSFPSRHHPSPECSGTTYMTSFPSYTGLHPTLRLSFPSTSMQPPIPTCALHTYLTLPSVIFPDKYQLSSPLFLSSKNLRAIRSLSGAMDLEAPDWIVSKWGSAILIEIVSPVPSKHRSTGLERSQDPWHADIPLHLRYLPPTPGGASNVSIPWPVVFWACPADEGTKMSTSPFDRVNLGYEGLFGPRTMFYHLKPQSVAGEILVETVQVPVLDSHRARSVEVGTVGMVLVGCIWIVGKLLGILGGGGRGLSHPQSRKTE